MNIQEAAKKLLAGELVVFPTETVYGLGALISNDAAVKKIFAVKGRPSINPLIVHIADPLQLKMLVQEIPAAAQKLMEAFWPGPLTICFKKSSLVSDLVTAGLSTVCIRNPSHPMAHELLQSVNKPIAAPSANLSGRPSTTNFLDAKKQLEQQGVSILDGGASPLGLESTVIDCSNENIRLLRPGTITQQDLERALGEEIVDASNSQKISSPGQLLEHYAPHGNLQVICGQPEERHQWITKQSFPSGSTITYGIIGKTGSNPDKKSFLMAENDRDLATYAARLYQFLNWCDQEHSTHIILELPCSSDPLLKTLLNRLQKASRGNIVLFGKASF
jgi:L-threonylcarbamoyladenylate synthase